MTYMKTNPAVKNSVAPILQTVMKRAQLLKGEIAVATKNAEEAESGEVAIARSLQQRW